MPATEQVWIVDDDRSMRWVLEKAFAQAGLTSLAFASGDAALRRLALEQPGVILSDIRMQGASGLELLAHIQRHCPQLPVIIMTAHADLQSAVNSYEGGAFEYLPKPFDLDDAVTLVRRALARAVASPAAAPAPAGSQTAGIIGKAPAMQEVFRAIGRLSHSAMTVLINGESGTGKELVARALHQHSPRSRQAFIALNMAAMPRELIESELFGHEKGAFTGAAAQQRGHFEQAAGGTLLLDEIGDMPLEAQTRLLRVLADGVFYRVGGHVPVQADVRIVAATHQNLEALVRQGRFREDLFHRLNVIRIHLPRLRDRREDIPQLAAFFLHRAALELNVEPRILQPETQRYLAQLDWPGNVRELENLCRWLTVMAPSREVQVSDLPRELLGAPVAAASSTEWAAALARWAEQGLARGERELLGRALPVFERTLISLALRHTAGRRREAADLLGWGRNTLTRKIRELGLGAEASDEGEDEGEGADQRA